MKMLPVNVLGIHTAFFLVQSDLLGEDLNVMGLVGTSEQVHLVSILVFMSVRRVNKLVQID